MKMLMKTCGKIMFFCPIHDQLRTHVDHDKQSKEKAVKNTRSNCGARYLLSSNQSKRVHLSVQSRQLIKSCGSGATRANGRTLLDVFHPSWKPNLLMICFISLWKDFADVSWILQVSWLVVAFFVVDVVVSTTDLCRDYGFFSNPSLDDIPFDALLLWILFQSKSWRNALRCAAICCNYWHSLVAEITRRWLDGDSDIGDFENAEMLSFNWKQKELVTTV